jgi:hypothetical protein
MQSFHKQRILFFWASTELEYPFPTIKQMDIAELMDFRKTKQTETIWHGKVMDLDYLIPYAELNDVSIYVFAISYADDTECAHIELHDTIHPPKQPNLL